MAAFLDRNRLGVGPVGKVAIVQDPLDYGQMSLKSRSCSMERLRKNLPRKCRYKDLSLPLLGVADILPVWNRGIQREPKNLG